MKPNLFPKMTAVQLRDREGLSVSLDVKVLAQNGSIYVFMSDRAGCGLIARNGAVFIQQLVERLQLHPTATRFFKHVYLPEQGSLFGRFDTHWKDAALISYHFSMLNPLDEGKQLRTWIAGATPVVISYAQTREVATSDK